MKYRGNERKWLGIAIFAFLMASPQTTLNALKEFLAPKWIVSNQWLSKWLKDHHWSLQIPTHLQLQKFTPDNIVRYKTFCNWVLRQPLEKLKFLDECHFVQRDLRIRKKCWSRKGKRPTIVTDSHFRETMSYTAIMSQQSIWFQGTRESNTQYDFLLNVALSINDGFLQPGDLLIMDNHASHAAADTWPCVLSMLNSAEIRLVFLPAYSPELNPIEKVFSEVKRHIRNCYNTEESMEDNIFHGFIAAERAGNFPAYYNKLLKEAQAIQ